MMKSGTEHGSRSEAPCELPPGALHGQDRINSAMDSALQIALEQKPEVAVPANFARRVALQAAALSPVPEQRVLPYARVTALVVSVLVAMALFALAPRAAASFNNLFFDLELAILLQLGLLAWWLVTEPSHGR